MIEKGFSGVFVKAFSLAPVQKRSADEEKKAVNIDSTISLSKEAKPSEVDDAFKKVASKITSEPATEAKPCSISSAIDLSVPDHFKQVDGLPDQTQSGFYIHFVCQRDQTKLRIFQEVDPPFDDALDQRLGIQCDNGKFIPPSSWPGAATCITVETCQYKAFKKPPDESRFAETKFTENDEKVKGEDLFYQCEDTNAILSTGERLGFFKVQCGEEGQFGLPQADDPTKLDYKFTFPVCKSQCKTFSVGGLFNAKEEDKALEIRAGDKVKFYCPEHYFADNDKQDYSVNFIESECQPDGEFTTALKMEKRCKKIPCTEEDIKALIDEVKVFKTRATGPLDVGKSITFTCKDQKVPSNGELEIETTCELGGDFKKPDWPEKPMCVNTCANFPKARDVPGMYPTSNLPVLAGKAVEYKCINKKLIPDTGEKFEIKCLDEGNFVVSV